MAATTRASSERGSAAITALGTLLRRASRSAAQALVGALSMAAADVAARADAVAGYARLATETRDPVARQLGGARAAERDTELADREAARLQYGYILTRIREGHALLKARAATITKDEAVQRIRAAQDDLRRNAATLQRGWPG